MRDWLTRRWHWVVVLAVGWLIGGAVPVRAQQSCSYAACALRIEGGDILQGMSGEQAGELGLVYKDVRILKAGPDSAAFYAGVYERRSGRGFWLSLAGSVFSGAGMALSSPDELSTLADLGLAVGGAGLFVWGSHELGTAQTGLSRAVWWFNEAAADGAALPHPAELPPLDPADYSGGGAVLGSLGGLGVGLAMSADHPHTETVEGVLETTVYTLAGGLAGWLAGSAIQR